MSPLLCGPFTMHIGNTTKPPTRDTWGVGEWEMHVGDSRTETKLNWLPSVYSTAFLFTSLSREGGPGDIPTLLLHCSICQPPSSVCISKMTPGISLFNWTRIWSRTVFLSPRLWIPPRCDHLSILTLSEKDDTSIVYGNCSHAEHWMSRSNLCIYWRVFVPY